MDDQKLADTYRMIQQSVPEVTVDSLEVVRQVEEYRQYWKPHKTNVVLLAESHVYTDEADFEMKLCKSILPSELADYPHNFVRFVYCLGYGENELLAGGRSEARNNGTPQYWKIFSSCVAENESNLGFDRVLKTGTPSFIERLNNKVRLLRELMKKGIWLMDASIVGLYGGGQKDPRLMVRVLDVCWKNYIIDTILEASPEHIIVIGKGVANILGHRLYGLKIPLNVIPQPQARGSSDYQLENYKKYQRICARYE